jgi:aminopeptidase-like protein
MNKENSTMVPSDTYGKSMYSLIENLYPICRSITGNGVRQTLYVLQEFVPLKIHEVPTGTKVFDWTVPKEWNITEAWIKDSHGNKIVDFNDSNLYVLNYSIPVNKNIKLSELKEQLYTLPEQPDLIPYRTSYYKEQWGFCLPHNQFLNMEDDVFQVSIDSTLEDGSLSYGELFIQGDSADEVLISCHICHPSLANDNLSGISVTVHLAESLLEEKLEYSYRFLFIPGTIGSITWLARNEDKIKNIKHGLVLSCVGDEGNITYKKSREGDAEINRIVDKVLTDSNKEYEVRDFSPYGYDERQFCSPAFNLPIGCFMRTPFGEFPEYHTSADNLDFVKAEALADSFTILKSIIWVIENNRKYINLNPKCEPNLGKRGLYKFIGGDSDNEIDKMALLWVLNLSDGTCSLLDIAERSGSSFEDVKKAADLLADAQLIKEVETD